MLQADDRVHFTHLKNMSDSPAHYLASVEEGFDSAAMAFGRLVHHLVFGGVEGRDYIVYDRGVVDVDYVIYDKTKTKAGKVWETFRDLNPDKMIFLPGDLEKPLERKGDNWKKFQVKHEGKDVVTRDEIDEASKLAIAVRTDPVVQRLGLLEGEHEKMVDWEYYGVPFRSHLDCIGKATRGERKGRRHLWDLKTCQSAKPEKFHWEARRLHYPAQLATYEDAARYIEKPIDDAYIVAVEKKRPHCVVVYPVAPELREEGRRLTRGWIERLNLCRATGVYPGYVQDVVPMNILVAGVDTRDSAPLLLTMEDGSQLEVH